MHAVMRIECPSCSAAYDPPEEQLAAGRAVRCARCGAKWTPIAQVQPAPATTPIVAPPRPPHVKVLSPLQPIPVAAALRQRRPVERELLLGSWVLSIAVLLLLGWAAVTWREGIMRAWPPSERAYAALGLVGPAQP